MDRQLPSFFVVGAQKAGTTSLHDWLVQQPDICLPVLKETQFFTFEKLYERGIDWYLKQFPACVSESAKGEVCPDYMFFPEAASRIRQHIIAPKLIFIFRHPLKRAFSHYLMSVRNGHETLTFVEALKAEKERLASGSLEALAHFSYLQRGRYAEQVERFQAIFPESKMLFVRFEDLVDRGDTGRQTYANICHFIGLKSSPSRANREVHANAASTPLFRSLGHFLHRESKLKNMLVRIIPGRTFRVWLWSGIDRLNQRPSAGRDIGPVPDEVIRDIHDEIIKLQQLTGLELSSWLT